MPVMDTYYLKFKVIPSPRNSMHEKLAGAYAECWVRERTPDRAQSRAEHYLIEYGWEIRSVELKPIGIVAERLLPKGRLGEINYRKAQRYGIAVHLSGWPLKN